MSPARGSSFVSTPILSLGTHAMRSERKITLEREAFHIRRVSVHIRAEGPTFPTPEKI